jgi:hypothetical protein
MLYKVELVGWSLTTEIIRFKVDLTWFLVGWDECDYHYRKYVNVGLLKGLILSVEVYGNSRENVRRFLNGVAWNLKCVFMCMRAL